MPQRESPPEQPEDELRARRERIEALAQRLAEFLRDPACRGQRTQVRAAREVLHACFAHLEDFDVAPHQASLDHSRRALYILERDVERAFVELVQRTQRGDFEVPLRYFEIVSIRLRTFFVLRACSDPPELGSAMRAMDFAAGRDARIEAFLAVLGTDLTPPPEAPLTGYRSELLPGSSALELVKRKKPQKKK